MPKQETIAWHFTKHKVLRDGSAIPAIGVPLVHTGPIEICRYGLHASTSVLDALAFAPGPVVHRVLCSGIAEEHSDKFVCTQRTIIASADATEELESFARWSALQVVNLWDCPDIMLQYLKTGDQELRDAAVARAASRASYASYAAARAVSYAISCAHNDPYVAADAADAYAAASFAHAAYAHDAYAHAADARAAADVYASAAEAVAAEQNQELELRFKKLLNCA